MRIFTLFSSVQFSRSVMSNPLWSHGLQHARLPCTSTPETCSNLCALSQWCLPTISSSAVPLSSCLTSFPASGSLPMSQLFTSGSQSIRASASTSVPPMNIQDWFSLGWTVLISLKSKGLSRVFSNIIVQKHQFFGTQSLWSKLSHLSMTTGKTTDLTVRTFVGKVMPLLFNMHYVGWKGPDTKEVMRDSACWELPAQESPRRWKAGWWLPLVGRSRNG